MFDARPGERPEDVHSNSVMYDVATLNMTTILKMEALTYSDHVVSGFT